MEADNNSNEPHFLLLGKTGVGKSTISKILSENKSIIIGDSFTPQTKKSNSYECKIAGFKFQLIDTPGYDHDKQNDNEHFEDIKRMLSSDNYNIKGIFLVFSFQDVRFSDSHRQGFEKIVNLVPLDDFWKYFGIIFIKNIKRPWR